MQLLHTAFAQQFQRPDADAQVLVHTLAVKMIGHTGQLDFAVHRLIAHAQQGAVGHAKAQTVGRNRGAFHVDGDCAALAEAARRQVVVLQFPVAVVGGGHRTSAQHGLEVGARHLRHIGHGFLQRLLDFGQRRHGYPQRQVVVEHMVVADIPVGQHVIAQHLAVAQSGAVTEHDPGVRTQHGHMVGHGLGVAGADSDVDHGDATVAGPYQMVGRHLRQALRVRALHESVRRAMLQVVGDHIARFDKRGIAAGRILHGELSQADEFVDVELVIGEQHEVLEISRIGAAVVAQALQRIVHARRGEQRQRLRHAGRGVQRAVGDAVVHGVQVGPVKACLHALALRGREAAFVVGGRVQREMQRNRLLAGAHLQAFAMVGQQQRKLLAVIAGKQVRRRQCGLVDAGARHKAIGVERLAARHMRGHAGMDAHLRIKGAHVLRQVTGCHEVGKRLPQMLHRLAVNGLHLGKRGIGVRKQLRGDIGRGVVKCRCHARSSNFSCGPL